MDLINIRLATNFTSDKNTWAERKEKMFNQNPGLSRDQQSGEYSRL